MDGIDRKYREKVPTPIIRALPQLSTRSAGTNFESRGAGCFRRPRKKSERRCRDTMSAGSQFGIHRVTYRIGVIFSMIVRGPTKWSRKKKFASPLVRPPSQVLFSFFAGFSSDRLSLLSHNESCLLPSMAL